MGSASYLLCFGIVCVLRLASGHTSSHLFQKGFAFYQQNAALQSLSTKVQSMNEYSVNVKGLSSPVCIEDNTVFLACTIKLLRN